MTSQATIQKDRAKGTISCNRVHIFHADPGHGWIQASRKECEKLGILEKISSFSYQSQDGKTLYLEEDFDMTLYLNALGYNQSNNRPEFDDRYADNSFIRNLPSFKV